jgi:hypothetical protein
MENNQQILVQAADGAPNIFIVDPNAVVDNGQVSPRYVKHEDLMIYVELKAYMNPKSKYMDNSDTADKIITITKGIFYSSTNANQNAEHKKTAFTTDWTEMFNENKPYDVEGFGINSIDIEFNASMVPKIHIEFIDVRGKNLLERGDSPDNPYNVFYTFPYPLFELVVKGYFGQAIRMPLIMQKAITRFDPSIGSYIISADFMSFTFAILNDLVLLYALITPYMFPKPDGTYEGKLMIDQKFDEYFSEQCDIKDSSKKRIIMKDLFFLNEKVSKIVKDNFGDTIMKRKSSIDLLLKTLDLFKDSIGKLAADDTASLKTISQACIATMLGEQTKLVAQGYSDQVQHWDINGVLSPTLYTNDDGTVKPMSDDNYDKLAQPINKFSTDTLLADVDSIKNILSTNLTFYPSLQNVVIATVVHLDAFMQLLVNKTQEIFPQSNNQNRTFPLSDDGDTRDYDVVESGSGFYRLPWPEFYRVSAQTDDIDQVVVGSGNSYVREYPGVSPKEKIRNWGEVKFIDAMYAAMAKFTMEMNLGFSDTTAGGGVFITSPLCVPIDSSFHTIQGNTPLQVLNKFIAKVLLMLYHNGLLYRQTDTHNRIDTDGIYSYFINHMVDDLFAPERDLPDITILIGALKEITAGFTTIDNYQTYMAKQDGGTPNSTNIDSYIYGAFASQFNLFVVPHNFNVPDKWLPDDNFAKKYMLMKDDQVGTKISYRMAPNGVLYNPKALEVLKLYNFDNYTKLGEDQQDVCALMFTNDYYGGADDIFITRQYGTV